MLTICVSGPERTRAQAEVALEDARVPVLPSDHHALMDWQTKLPPVPSGDEPDEPHGFLTVEHDDVDRVVAAVEKAGWVLRVHYETPEPPKPDPVAVTLAEMRAEIAALRARVGV